MIFPPNKNKHPEFQHSPAYCQWPNLRINLKLYNHKSALTFWEYI